MEDAHDSDSSGLHCDECGAKIDEEDEEQFHEPTGWYFCPQCGHNNTDE